MAVGILALFALLFAVINAATSGWSDGLVISGLIVAAIFLLLFIAVERRSAAPLLRLDLFRSRPFAVNSVVTVLGMCAFLGTAYSTSIRLSAIQGFPPLKTAIAFVLLQGFALVLMPLTARAVRRYNPRWALGGGFLLVGVGFAFALSGVTAVAVNTVPTTSQAWPPGSPASCGTSGSRLGRRSSARSR